MGYHYEAMDLCDENVAVLTKLSEEQLELVREAMQSILDARIELSQERLEAIKNRVKGDGYEH
jgi:hypothetical protein